MLYPRLIILAKKGRCISALDLILSAKMSPTGVVLKPFRFKEKFWA